MDQPKVNKTPDDELDLLIKEISSQIDAISDSNTKMSEDTDLTAIPNNLIPKKSAHLFDNVSSEPLILDDSVYEEPPKEQPEPPENDEPQTIKTTEVLPKIERVEIQNKKEKARVVDDYSDLEDRDEVLEDLIHLRKKMTVKSVFVFVFLLAELYLTVGKISYLQFIFPSFISMTDKTSLFCLVQLGLTAFCLLLNAGSLFGGLKRLFRAGLSSDGCLLALGVSCLALDAYYFVMPYKFLAVPVNFDLLFLLGIFVNLLAKRKMVNNIILEFSYITSSQNMNVVCAPRDLAINNDLMMETGNGGDVLFIRKTKLVTNYLERSFDEITENKGLQVLNFLLVLLAGGASVGLFFTKMINIYQALILLNSLLAIISPIFWTLNHISAVARMSSSLNDKQTVIAGTSAADSLAEGGILVTGDEGLTSNLEFKLKSMQLRNDCDSNELLVGMSALFQTLQKPLAKMFFNVLNKKDFQKLPEVKNVKPYPRLGYAAEIGGRNLLVGNELLMKEFSVEIPEQKCEPDQNIIYVSSKGVLLGMFVVSCRLENETAEAIQTLDRQNYSLAVMTDDFVLRDSMFGDSESWRGDTVTILSHDTAKVCAEACAEVPQAQAQVVTFDGMRGIVAGIAGGSKLLFACLVQNAFRITASIFGFIMLSIILLWLGTSLFWLPFQILAYQLLWALPAKIIALKTKI